MTVILYALLAIVLICAIFLVFTRVLPPGEQIAPVIRDDPPWALPADQELAAQDVVTVRLPVALRGYRFAETDQLLDRLADELRGRDAEIARLRARVPVPAADFAAPSETPSETPLEAPAPNAPGATVAPVLVAPAPVQPEPATPPAHAAADLPAPSIGEPVDPVDTDHTDHAEHAEQAEPSDGRLDG